MYKKYLKGNYLNPSTLSQIFLRTRSIEERISSVVNDFLKRTYVVVSRKRAKYAF